MTIEKICEGIRLGLYNKDAAIRAGISAGTFYSWISKAKEPDAASAYVEFLESLEHAQADLKAILLARIQKASTDGQWQAATWILARKFPEGIRPGCRAQREGQFRTPARYTPDRGRSRSSW